MSLIIADGRSLFYQWDTGQQLIVENGDGCREVHFCHNGDETALVCVIREAEGRRVADVPNILLQRAGTLMAYLSEETETATRIRHVNSFCVKPRPKPEDYLYTETEVLNYTSLSSRLEKLEGEGISRAVEAYLKENPVGVGSGASIFYSNLSFEYNAGSMLSLFNCDKQEIRRNGRNVQVGDLIIFGNLSLGIVEKVTDIYVSGSLYASLKGESGSGGGLDATIDGETLVFAESSTATIENETLIL